MRIHPLVANAFPYVETLPIRDDRLTKLCRIIAQSGLNGTGVFRADDPMWKKFKPPRYPGCRCGTVYLTFEMAAKRGVREAQEWLESGEAPTQPEWVPHPPVVLPPGWARPT